MTTQTQFGPVRTTHIAGEDFYSVHDVAILLQVHPSNFHSASYVLARSGQRKIRFSHIESLEDAIRESGSSRSGPLLFEIALRRELADAKSDLQLCQFELAAKTRGEEKLEQKINRDTRIDARKREAAQAEMILRLRDKLSTITEIGLAPYSTTTVDDMLYHAASE